MPPGRTWQLSGGPLERPGEDHGSKFLMEYTEMRENGIMTVDLANDDGRARWTINPRSDQMAFMGTSLTRHGKFQSRELAKKLVTAN
ncbi:hypothetical protein VTN49DRAFT_2504 [Thermomyces lanuginosus]|uniref:uncharacterized protein n=1 Tax=Thermomyces lanuginosus TaxID=5541 RepID=UPI0037447167